MEKKKRKALNDAEIASTIASMARDAVGFSSDQIANKHEQALKLYKRDPLPGDDKLVGRSKWVSPDVMERVDWSVASMTRLYDSTAMPVQFLPNGPEDEPLAKQMTDTCNFVVRSKNSHVAILEPWLKNGFITGLGVTMVEFRACREEGLPELLKGVPDEQLVALTQQEEAGEIIIVEAGEPYSALPPMPDPNVPPEMAMMVQAMAPMVRDLKIRRIKNMRHMDITNLPPEDFIVSKDAQFDQQTGGIKARLQGHRRIIARQDLIEQGFDAEKVKSIPSAEDKNEGIAVERSSLTDHDQGVGENDVTVYEIYTRLAIEDDKRRHYRFTLAGDLENAPVLLAHEEVSKFYPYAAFCPYPIPNTLFGYGIADRIGDDQILLSKMHRGVLNSLNMHIDPLKIVNPEVTNVDDLINPFPGAVIRSSDPTGGISYNQPPFAGAAAMPVIDQLKTGLDFVTGVGGGMQAVNASDLQNTTATATSQRANSAQLFIEMIARQFADTGYRYLFKVMIDLFVQYPEDAQAYITRLTNGYVPIKVDQWNPDMDVTTTVAFGVLNKDFNAATLQMILGQQQQMMQMSPQLVTPQHIYATVTKIVENAGFKNPGAFWVDPATVPPPPPPPPPVDPNAGLIEVERVKAELRAQAEAAAREFDLIKLRVEDDRKRDEMAQDFELRKAEIQAKYAAQIDIARIQLEQAAQRNGVDLAIQAQQTQQAALEQQQQAEQQAQAQLAHALRSGNDATPFRGGNDATPPQF